MIARRTARWLLPALVAGVALVAPPGSAGAPDRANSFGEAPAWMLQRGRPVVAAALPPAGAARRGPRVDPAPASRDRIGAWVVPWDREAGLASLEANAHVIGRVSPFWFELLPRARMRASAGAYDLQLLRIARRNHMRILPTVSNSFEPSRVSWVVATEARRVAHVRHLVSLVEARGYHGIDVDYENVAPRDRARYTRFVQLLARELHARGRLLSVTVMAKTRDAGHSPATASMDYAALGRAVDELRIMAYDYHWSCGAPGPVAPVTWVEDVVEYTVSRVAPSKVVLGVPFYGYDWPRSGCAAARTWEDVAAIQRRTGITPRFNVTWKTSVLAYMRRQAWFDERRSLTAKARVARAHGIRGVFAWRLGGEDPGLWRPMAATLGASLVVEHPSH